jgi:hypothetical protein
MERFLYHLEFFWVDLRKSHIEVPDFDLQDRYLEDFLTAVQKLSASLLVHTILRK